MVTILTVLLFFTLLCSVIVLSIATDTLGLNEFIKDGETIVSGDGSFELGFTNISTSDKRYVAIWYKKIPIRTVVWIANREHPLNDSSGILKLTEQGNLNLLNATNNIIWSSKLLRTAENPIAQLLGTGNLVVRDANDNDNNEDNFLWQSFDHLGNTILPGVKFGRNLVTGHDRYLVAWKSSDDPSPGDCTTRLDPGGYPQNFISKGSDIVFRSGPWNGLRFSGMPYMRNNNLFTYEFVYNEKEIFYKYDLVSNSFISRLELTPSGMLQRYTWVDRTLTWNLYSSAQMDNCDRFAVCGAFGGCNINNSPACGCLKGFAPKYPQEWEAGDWSSGCVRKTKSECGIREGFQKIGGVKLPDTRHSWFNRTMNLKECEIECLKNCSCTAYASLDVRGSGCLLWFNELLDIRYYAENGQDIYIRLADSDIENGGSKRRKRVRLIVIPVMILTLVFLGLYLIRFLVKRKKLKRAGTRILSQEREYTDEERDKDLELPLFDLATIASATQDFSETNKLGEGGYGPVYKGTLSDGQDIAVKRLSKESKQGQDEFKNEVLCIAKLQHRNLVKLLGCCIEIEEKMLIYEFMPNRSLDSFIFDQNRRSLLDWTRRFNIITGIGRGLLYLHQDSRLRIIHRDLKASNILLDSEMNAKISDFGLARSFGGNETEANTKRVVGTYGYMSPEYAIDGIFSIKSDVFSFGVLVLEILSGRRNRGFFHSDHKHNLLGHAWRLHKEGRPLELVDDDSLKDSCILSEVLRTIHVGLLCVQQSPEDRPNMATVVLMLTSDIALPHPKGPGFFTERELYETDSSSSKVGSCSANNVSITLLTAR